MTLVNETHDWSLMNSFLRTCICLKYLEIFWDVCRIADQKIIPCHYFSQYFVTTRESRGPLCWILMLCQTIQMNDITVPCFKSHKSNVLNYADKYHWAYMLILTLLFISDLKLSNVMIWKRVPAYIPFQRTDVRWWVLILSIGDKMLC